MPTGFPYRLASAPVASLRDHPQRHVLPPTSGKDFQRLKLSIATFGIMTPLQVLPDGDGYVVLCGHERLRAADELGFETVPVIVIDDKSLMGSPQRQLLWMVAENATRRGLDAGQRAMLWAAPQVVDAARVGGADVANDTLADMAGVAPRMIADAMLVRAAGADKVSDDHRAEHHAVLAGVS